MGEEEGGHCVAHVYTVQYCTKHKCPISSRARSVALRTFSFVVRACREGGVPASVHLRISRVDVGGPGVLLPEAKHIRDPGQVSKAHLRRWL